MLCGKATEVVTSVEGVSDVKRLEEGETESGTATLRVTADTEVRHRICRALVNADVDVFGIEPSRDLEEAFIELTVTEEGQR